MRIEHLVHSSFIQVETQHLHGSDIDTSDDKDSTGDDGDIGNVISTRNCDGGEDSDSSSGDLKEVIRAQIPNYEIQSTFTSGFSITSWTS